MTQEFKNRALLRAFVNIMPDDNEAQETFERVHGPIFHNAQPADYFFHADKFRQAWTAKEPSEREQVNRNLEEIFKTERPLKRPEGWPVDQRINIRVNFGDAEFPITIQPRDLLDKLVLILLTSEHLGVCANPQCSEKYFVAADRKQKYCSYDCADVRRRQAKMEWWDEHGDKWRKDRQQSTRTKKGKKTR